MKQNTRIDKNLKLEIYRKLFHLNTIFIPILYVLTDFDTSIVTFAILSLLSLIFDLLRLRILKNSTTLHNITRITGIHYIFREHEKNRISGASYLFLASVICIIFVNQITFVIAFSILALADSAAALIGKYRGRRKIKDKTLEGSIAFFITAIISAIPFIAFYQITDGKFFITLFLCIIITTFTELYTQNKKLDDNFIIPITFCFSFHIMSIILNMII